MYVCMYIPTSVWQMCSPADMASLPLLGSAPTRAGLSRQQAPSPTAAAADSRPSETLAPADQCLPQYTTPLLTRPTRPLVACDRTAMSTLIGRSQQPRRKQHCAKNALISQRPALARPVSQMEAHQTGCQEIQHLRSYYCSRILSLNSTSLLTGPGGKRTKKTWPKNFNESDTQKYPAFQFENISSLHNDRLLEIT